MMQKTEISPEKKPCYSGDDGVIAYCDHCGFPIYRKCDGLLIHVNGDRIHRECWEEYAEEHLFEFAESAEDSDRFDCDM